jgi:hypothetical protein
MDDANDHEINEYYTEGATDLDNYIDSAFRSTRKNEAYTEENVVMNYAAWMYYVDRLNNGQHPKGRKQLSIGYDFKCAK